MMEADSGLLLLQPIEFSDFSDTPTSVLISSWRKLASCQRLPTSELRPFSVSNIAPPRLPILMSALLLCVYIWFRS